MPANANREVIVLWADGMISIAYEPGGEVEIMVGGSPPQELTDVLDSARALVEASVKAPAFRDQYMAEVEELLRTHSAQIRKFCEEQVLTHA